MEPPQPSAAASETHRHWYFTLDKAPSFLVERFVCLAYILHSEKYVGVVKVNTPLRSGQVYQLLTQSSRTLQSSERLYSIDSEVCKEKSREIGDMPGAVVLPEPEETHPSAATPKRINRAIVWIFGPGSCGKSDLAEKCMTALKGEFYTKSCTTTEWVDYNGQKNVVLDRFDVEDHPSRKNSLRWGHLDQLFDSRVGKVKVSQRKEASFLGENIIVISRSHPLPCVTDKYNRGIFLGLKPRIAAFVGKNFASNQWSVFTVTEEDDGCARIAFATLDLLHGLGDDEQAMKYILRCLQTNESLDMDQPAGKRIRLMDSVEIERDVDDYELEVAEQFFDMGLNFEGDHDLDNASRCYQAAVSCDPFNHEALLRLGMMCLGIVSDDEEKAYGLFMRAQELGNLDAMVALGMMFENGDYVERDLDSAEQWYRKVIEIERARLRAAGLKVDENERDSRGAFDHLELLEEKRKCENKEEDDEEDEEEEEGHSTR